MYKLLTSARECSDSSIGFDRSRDTRQRKLTTNKTQKGKFHLTVFLRDVFGFAEHQDEAIVGLGYKLKLTRITDNAALIKGNATDFSKIKFNSIEWYVPHHTPSITQQNILLNLILKKIATELQYPERSVFMKEDITQNFRSFDLGSQEGVNVPVWIYVVFQQSDRQHDRNLNNDIFVRLPVISAQVVMGTERYPDSAIILNYNVDGYSQVYGQIKEALKAPIKDDILQPHIFEGDLGRLMMIMILVIIYTLSIYDIRKILKVLNL